MLQLQKEEIIYQAHYSATIVLCYYENLLKDVYSSGQGRYGRHSSMFKREILNMSIQSPRSNQDSQKLNPFSVMGCSNCLNLGHVMSRN